MTLSPETLPTTTGEVAHTIAAIESSWTPSAEQRRAKAKLTVALRDDSLLTPANLSGPAAASIVGVSAVESWWSDPRFRKWFLDNYESAAKAEFLFDEWLNEIGARMTNMSDKDLLTAGKLLSELARKMPDKNMRERVLDAGIGAMAPDRLRQFIVDSAQAIGLRLIESEGEK
jgi:hypothetical protein